MERGILFSFLDSFVYFIKKKKIIVYTIELDILAKTINFLFVVGAAPIVFFLFLKKRLYIWNSHWVLWKFLCCFENIGGKKSLSLSIGKVFYKSYLFRCFKKKIEANKSVNSVASTSDKN